MSPNWYVPVTQAEPMFDYRPGGFHPVAIGDKLHNRYQIVDKLGYGGYSTIWLARDMQRQQYVSIKIGTSRSISIHGELDAIQKLQMSQIQAFVPLLRELEKYPVPDVLPTIIDQFTLNGPNGTHACYAAIPMLGDLRNLCEEMSGLPLRNFRHVCAKLALCVAHIHAKDSRGYVF